ncbi:PTS maltose transporter subunit IIBC [Tepidanaerobacter syntrophicus]|uniref:PTS sugar transporter subunit IIA n=1 Tax=Tepidanaerobacter syntrophicus TaxID=224999 RepID=UPI001BD60740|nr:PTS sugar transporter subunit IIA [Tepidanaerobacter syntrophicus]GLI50368.1 PTS maltose transporter subunit IIBC [Tepidanaerobacter syntrophicus]
MISELLNENTIKIYDSVKDWKEAGKIAGKLLVDTGKVKESFIDAMIKSVEEYGPYIVIAPGIALFHARPEDGVKSMCLSLVIVKNGVYFNSGDKDPVKLVFVLGAVDNESHLRLLSELVNLLQDKNLVKMIISAHTEKDVIQLIQKKQLETVKEL